MTGGLKQTNHSFCVCAANPNVNVLKSICVCVCVCTAVMADSPYLWMQRVFCYIRPCGHDEAWDKPVIMHAVDTPGGQQHQHEHPELQNEGQACKLLAGWWKITHS